MPLVKLALCALLLGAGRAELQNGYVASFTMPNQILSTLAPKLNASNIEIARLSDSFTVMMWMRFNDVSPNRLQYVFGVLSPVDVIHFTPFAGGMDGFVFGSRAPPMVSTLGASATQWHHYAMSWRSSDGLLTSYIDGLPIGSQVLGAGLNFIQPAGGETFLTLGGICKPATHFSSEAIYTECNRDFAFNGEIDDIAVFSGKLNDSKITALWNQSISDHVQEEPDLVLFWNFNDPLPGSVRNLGTAGRDYDLILGHLPKQSCADVFSVSYRDYFAGGRVHNLRAPVMVPGAGAASQMPRVPDTSAPLVLSAAAAETVAIGESQGSNLSVTAPSHFVAAQVTNIILPDGTNISVHLVPRVKPQVPLPSELELTTPEDRPLYVQLWGSTTSSSPISARIVTLPTHGKLHDVPWEPAPSTNVVEVAGQKVTSPWVMYSPRSDFSGKDMFQYMLSVSHRHRANHIAHVPTNVCAICHPHHSQLDEFGLHSDHATVTINVQADDDLPQVSSSALQLTEDAHPDGVQVQLNASDAETGTPLAIVITKLPTKGDVYFEDASGRHRIEQPYSLFDVGSVFSQYLDRVVAVSSFWGAAPYSGYHPLNILGPPDCASYGECSGEGAWVTDAAVYPNVGQLVIHATAPAYVVATDPSARTVTIEYAKMYKL